MWMEANPDRRSLGRIAGGCQPMDSRLQATWPRILAGQCGPLKLTREQLDAIPELLGYGSEAYGFLGEVWTCARLATVLRREFGVSYHKAHVSRLLKDLNWTPQMPIERAAQRDETLIQRWRTAVWPELKKRR
jgi:transposase